MRPLSDSVPPDLGARVVFFVVTTLMGVVAAFAMGHVLPFLIAVLLGGWVVLWSLVAQRIQQGPRRLPHECPNCGYDRRGVPGNSPCPECGQPHGVA